MNRNSLCKKKEKAFQEKRPALFKALESRKRIENSKKQGVAVMHSCEWGATRDKMTRFTGSEQEGSHMPCQGFLEF